MKYRVEFMTRDKKKAEKYYAVDVIAGGKKDAVETVKRVYGTNERLMFVKAREVEETKWIVPRLIAFRDHPHLAKIGIRYE